MSARATAEDYPRPRERWRSLHTGEVVTITVVGNLGSTWFRREDGSTGRAGHSAFLPGREQAYERAGVLPGPPELRFKKACSDCPFRRDSAPGWLGAGTPESFVEAAEADYCLYDLPCHQTIDYEDPEWRDKQYPDSALCAGALIFAANQCKDPRDPRRSANVGAVEQDPTVFRTGEEFIAHHRSGGARSWQEDE